MTRKILEEIRFYEKYQPYKLFKSGVFGSGAGIQEEHLITIKLDLEAEGDMGQLSYKDIFEYDILSMENVPENIANAIVEDMNLTEEFKYYISMGIRKRIKEHVHSCFSNFVHVFIKLKEEALNINILKEKTEKVLGRPLNNSKKITNTQNSANLATSNNNNITSKSIASTNSTINTNLNHKPNNIFATYIVASNNNNVGTANVNSAIVPPIITNPVIFKLNEGPAEYSQYRRMNNKLPKPLLFLFESKTKKMSLNLFESIYLFIKQ